MGPNKLSHARKEQSSMFRRLGANLPRDMRIGLKNEFCDDEERVLSSRRGGNGENSMEVHNQSEDRSHPAKDPTVTTRHLAAAFLKNLEFALGKRKFII